MGFTHLRQAKSGRGAPVVVMLGWWGASPSALRKYSELYHEAGFDVVEYTAPASVLFAGKSAQDRAGRKLLGWIGERYSGAVPVTVHALSNNGCMVLLALARVARREPRQHGWMLGRMQGVVLDSAPGDLTFATGLSAFLANNPPLPARLAVLGLPVLVMVAAIRALLRLRRMRGLGAVASVYAGFFFSFFDFASFWNCPTYQHVPRTA